MPLMKKYSSTLIYNNFLSIFTKQFYICPDYKISKKIQLLKKVLFIILLLTTASAGQNISVPSVTLTGINTHISVEELPDSTDSLKLLLKSDNQSITHILAVKNGIADTSIIIENSGTYVISSAENTFSAFTISVLPGWLSLVPPMLAIFLALLLRQVVISLAAGIYAGALFLYGFDPFAALLRLVDVFIINALIDKDHMYIIVFTLLIGGVVGIISRNGGTAGLAFQITKLAKTPRSGMISSWLMGVLIFFDDYANSLIIGNMMRPITDRLKISREKLAYIVDSTAAPIASIFLISTWIGYEVGLIEDGLRAIGSTENAYDIFLSSIPYSFYPIAAIIFVFIVSYFSRDFGPMYKAEKRARETGAVSAGDQEAEDLKDTDHQIYTGEKSRWINGLVPILTILFGTMIGLYFTGVDSLESNGITDYNLQDIITYADSYSALLWSSFIATIVAVLMTVVQRIISIHDIMEGWTKGVQSMMVAVIILVFAWSISAVTNDMKTADYLVSIISDSMSPRFLPVLVFIICAFTGFSTGTSWGTMAIVMPIVIPLTHKLSMSAELSNPDYWVIMYGVISSVLAGSVFGDHCSPIADTTILSSLASKCNHIDHVNTQLPYAIIVGVVCIILGYIPGAFGINPFLLIGLIIITLIIILRFFGKALPEVKMDEDTV